MSEIILRCHALRHLPDLKVHPDVLHARFRAECSVARCAGQCCEEGAWVDAAERDAILRHGAQIQALMDPSQEQNPERWFDPTPWDHTDFPSGRAVSTAAINGACVFLGSDRRCVLQKASTADTGTLKPFFCIAFPLTIVDGVLCFDDARDAACCTPDACGSVSALEFCAYELRHMLGTEGVEELQAHMSRESE
jgi:Fe-S-cluster containining protein